jgi:hypothetical protein
MSGLTPQAAMRNEDASHQREVATQYQSSLKQEHPLCQNISQIM